jgi:hypothetical protein
MESIPWPEKVWRMHLFIDKEAKMPAPTKEETLLMILKESAVKKYGEERAKVLEPPLQDLARALVAVENYPLELEEEPSFAR